MLVQAGSVGHSLMLVQAGTPWAWRSMYPGADKHGQGLHSSMARHVGMLIMAALPGAAGPPPAGPAQAPGAPEGSCSCRAFCWLMTRCQSIFMVPVPGFWPSWIAAALMVTSGAGGKAEVLHTCTRGGCLLHCSDAG
jgi:hypothetical protein